MGIRLKLLVSRSYTWEERSRTSVVCVLEDMVRPTSFPYYQNGFCNNSFIPWCLFHFFVIVNYSVWFVFDVFCSFCFFQHLRLLFVVLLIKRHHHTWEWRWKGVGSDCVKMGENENVKIYSRSCLITTERSNSSAKEGPRDASCQLKSC